MEYRWLYNERSAPGVNYDDSEVAAKYDETHSSLYDPVEQACEILDQLDITEDSVLVDLGAGTGTLAVEAAKRCKRVFAVDISPSMFCYARMKAEKSGMKNIDFIESGFLTYEHKSDEPDVIVSLIALHHLPDFWKAVALQRIYDLLKPGGQFLLSDCAYSFPLSEYQTVYSSKMSRRKSQVSRRLFEQMQQDSSTEFMTFTWILEGILDRVGFVVEKAAYATELSVLYICRKQC